MTFVAQFCPPYCDMNKLIEVTCNIDIISNNCLLYEVQISVKTNNIEPIYKSCLGRQVRL